MKRIGFVITARLGSSRLGRKHLLEVDGRHIITYLIDRIRAGFRREIDAGEAAIVLATTERAEDRAFEAFASPDVAVFFGSEQNIPLRLLRAAETYRLDGIINAEGDDILCSLGAMRRVYEALVDGAPYVKTTGLPFGLNSFGLSREFLAGAMRGREHEVFDTGWLRLFGERQPKHIDIDGTEEQGRLRFSLDYLEDYEFLKRIIQRLGPSVLTATDAQVVDLALRERLYEINRMRIDEYWKNFASGMESEERKARAGDAV